MRQGVLARLSVDRVEMQLRDGTPVTVRPILPADRELIRTGFQRLSEESRLRRFLAPISKLSEGQLDYLTNVDYWDHFAWVGVRTDDPDVGMGVARYVRLPSEPSVAESAVTILDEYQRRGLGTLLLGLLAAAARTAGIESFRAYVLEENAPMRGLLAGLGARASFDSPGVVRVDIPLDPDQMPDSPVARAVKAMAAKVMPGSKQSEGGN
ncbi:MAG: GNAT family N-acetyltransferase [Actinomycetota bacterium]